MVEIDLSGFDFRASFQDISDGLVLKPLLHTYLFDASFPEFTLTFSKQEMERAPDNWYHPSTHPMWTEKALYEYLTNPNFPIEKKKYMSTLAVMMGKITHEFLQICLTDANLRPAEMQVCHSCGPDNDCNEAGFRNDDLGERGHVDGLLHLPMAPPDLREPVWEFKTSHDNFGRLSNVKDLDLATFRQKWPTYWAQQQRYQHMSGRRMSVVLFMEMVYPFVMREFHVPYDLGWNLTVDAKYRRVRQAVADQMPPLCCGMKGCVSALPCGLMN